MEEIGELFPAVAARTDGRAFAARSSRRRLGERLGVHVPHRLSGVLGLEPELVELTGGRVEALWAQVRLARFVIIARRALWMREEVDVARVASGRLV